MVGVRAARPGGGCAAAVAAVAG
eukprot:COSAG06_NODE_6234_length_3026_cov_2.496071_4_plen_22_part_01